MPITGTNKNVDSNEILCDESAIVTLSITGEPNISETPTDIMLVLDRSGSMSGQPLLNLKSAANQFVDIIDKATDGILDGIIGGGSRIGVVSFASTASLDQSLTDNANNIKTAVNNLSAGGGTNHAPAFQAAQNELAGSNPGSKKVLIMFTNGQGADSAAAATAAANARAAGTEIFGIGLGFANEDNLKEWATDPDDEHVFIAPSPEDIEEIFEIIGTVISEPAATDITVVDTVNSDFSLSDLSANKGNTQLNGNIITWTIDSLASSGPETITLSYKITHEATNGGVKKVNDSITYTDLQGNQLSFPDPSVNVLCERRRGISASIRNLKIY